MSMEYAVLDKSGKCINRIMLEEGSTWTPPDGCKAVKDPEKKHAIHFEPAPVPTPEQKLLMSGLTVDELKELLGLS